MDDLRTDLQDYLEHAVKPVDISDIVERDYVIVAAPSDAKGPRSGWRLRGLAASALVVLLAWGLIALTGGGPRQVGDSFDPDVTTQPFPGSTEPETSVEPPAEPVNFRYTKPEPGWELSGGFRLQKSQTGPQAAEGIVYWVAYPNNKNATNCGLVPGFYGTKSFDSLARAVAQAPGLTLVSGPDDVVVGGQPALHVQLEIAADEGCDPGYFYNWKAGVLGALWLKYSIGDAVDVWVVDPPNSQGSRLVIVGLTNPRYPTLRSEIQEFVSSIEFRTEEP
ncbi:MAG: hypothetical protein WBM90_01800 [Acidimicrobiia bacterium]